MERLNDYFEPFLNAWRSLTWDGAWPQLAAIAGAGLAALLIGVMARAAIKRHNARLFEQWPIGLVVLTAALAVLFALLNPLGQAELLRVAALLAAAATAVILTVNFMGRGVLAGLVIVLACAAAILEGLYLARPAIVALDAQGMDFGEVRITAWFVIKAVVVVGGMFWLAQRAGDLLAGGIAKDSLLTRSGNVLAAKLARAGLLAAALLFSLGFLGVDVTALAVLSGAVGLGIGFGLQKIVSNYVSGLILLMDRSIKPGDVIEVDFGSGRVRGEVTELAGRYTAITLRTGVETLVPNEVLISSPVSNWSHTSRNVQLRIPVGVSYDADVEAAIRLCVEAATAAPRVLAQPAPVCLLMGFGDSSVDLEVRFWISDAESGVRSVSSGVFLEIWKLFRRHGIEIPFPQRDLHIRSLPDSGDRVLPETRSPVVASTP